jgi:hypothetical protein
VPWRPLAADRQTVSCDPVLVELLATVQASVLPFPNFVFTTKSTKDTKIISEGTARRAPTLCVFCVLCGYIFFPSCSS